MQIQFRQSFFIAILLLSWFPFTQHLHAQTNTQFWSNFVTTWQKTPWFSYELDLVPKALVSAPESEPDWRNLDVIQTIEYAAKCWLDLSGELVNGYTKQTDDINSFEVTPRIGIRFHLFSNRITPLLKEKSPNRRVIIRDLIRVEYRSLFYTDDQGSDSSWRYRNRLEFLLPLNHKKLTEDNTVYTIADWEWFFPIGDVLERFSNKQRIRTGLGYRKSFKWQFEALYIWTRSRKNSDENFTTSDNIIDIRIRYRF
jgi:Protein of unknown function (DUF2490)